MQRSSVGHRRLRKGAFGFLKTVTHLYCLVRQTRPLCWSCIDVCNAFLVFFPLTFVESLVGVRIEVLGSITFLVAGERGMGSLVFCVA